MLLLITSFFSKQILWQLRQCAANFPVSIAGYDTATDISENSVMNYFFLLQSTAPAFLREIKVIDGSQEIED